MRRSPLVQLLLVRLLIFRREPEALFWTFGFPLIVIVVLGIAFRPAEAEPLPIVVTDGQAGDALAEALAREPELAVSRASPREAGQALGRGRALLVAEPGRPPRLRYDPTRTESRLAHLLALRALDPSEPGAIAAPSSEPGDRYVDFLVPGLVGMNVMMVCLWGVGWNIVDARARRLLRRLAVTPMRRSHYLGAFAIAHVGLVLLTLSVVLAFSSLVFDVRIVGSPVALLVVITLGALAFSALGVLLASRTANVEVLSGMVNAASLTQIVGSGVFFSTARFPEWLAPALRALPLTALADALRAIALEGRGLSAISIELSVLTAWIVLAGTLGLRLFRWS